MSITECESAISDASDDYILAALKNWRNNIYKPDYTYRLGEKDLEILLPLLQRNGAIGELTLEVMSLTPFSIDYMLNKYFPYIETIVSHFLQLQLVDGRYIEIVTSLMLKFCEAKTLKVFLFQREVLTKIFSLISTVDDSTKLLPLVKLLLCAIKYNESAAFIVENNDIFSLKILYVLLKKYVDLRDDILEILEIFLKFKDTGIDLMLYESEPVENILCCLEELEWNTHHLKVIELILELSNHMPVGEIIVSPRKFIRFLNAGKCGGPEHILACLLLITQFSKTINGQRLLSQCSVPKHIEHFCSCEIFTVKVTLCDLFAQLHKYMSARVIGREKILQFLINDVISKESYPYKAFRVSPVAVLYRLLREEPNLAMKMYKCGVMTPLSNFLNKRDKLEDLTINMVLSILKILMVCKPIQEELFTEKSFLNLLGLFQKSNKGIVIETIELLQLLLQSTKYKLMFFNANMEGLVPSLNTMAGISKLCYTEFSTIYDLSLKFYNEGILDTNDKIENGFILHLPPILPCAGLYSKEEYARRDIFLIVDFLKPEYVCQFKRVFKPICRRSANSASRRIMSPMEELRKMKKQAEDEEIKAFIKSMYVKVNKERDVEKKVKHLANYVHNQLNRKIIFPTFRSKYQNHIHALKAYYGVKPIPLSKICLGSIIEKTLLFKVLAERMGVPCTLKRNKNGSMWNEVPVPVNKKDRHDPNKQMHVVDLEYNIGMLMPIDGKASTCYCNGDELLKHSISQHGLKLSAEKKKYKRLSKL